MIRSVHEMAIGNNSIKFIPAALAKIWRVRTWYVPRPKRVKSLARRVHALMREWKPLDREIASLQKRLDKLHDEMEPLDNKLGYLFQVLSRKEIEVTSLSEKHGKVLRDAVDESLRSSYNDVSRDIQNLNRKGLAARSRK